MKMTLVTCAILLASSLTVVDSMGFTYKSKKSAAVESALIQRATELADQLSEIKLNHTELGKLSPIQKVLDMLNDLRMKVINEEKEAYILYSQYTALCDEQYRATSFLILGEEQEMDELRAALREELAEIAEMVAKIGKLTQNIAIKTRELKAARIQFDVDKQLYAAEIKELYEMIQMMRKAIEILESDKGQYLLQLNQTATLAQTMEAMVKAATISHADAQRITALVQQQQQSEDDDKDDDSLGAPTEAYEKRNPQIIELLASTVDKATEELDRAEKAEAQTKIDFALMEKALTDELHRDETTLAEIRGDQPGVEGNKARDQGDLVEVKDMLTIDMKTRNLSVAECIEARDEFTAESKLREEEVIVQTKAINAIRDSTGAETTHKFNFTTRLTNETLTFVQRAGLAFLQENEASSTHSGQMSTYFRAVRLVSDLGKDVKSTDLKLLAMRMTNAVKHSSGKDPFKKVKGLINDMIFKLEMEAAEEKDLHDWCEENMGKAEQAVADAMEAQFKAQARFDAAEAAWMKCKREIQEIGKSGALVENTVNKEGELRDKELKMLEDLRKENNAAMEGIDQAIKILNDYYGNDEATTETDAAFTIIELLKIVRVDLEKSLENAEKDAKVMEANYQKSLEERDISHIAFEKDLKHKTAEELKLRKKVEELREALEEANQRLSDAHDFYDKIKEKCLIDTDGFKERIAKMQKELEGLKEALKILQGDDEAYALEQEGSRRSLRGSQ